MTILAPSILSSDRGRLAEEIKAMADAGADWIHIDIIDGNFAPNLTFGPWVVEVARKVTDLPLDAHLMVTDPLTYAPIFARAGADYVSFHLEAATHSEKIVSSILDAGAKPGLALNPGTSLSALDELLDRVALIVLMGVNPGFSGQPFIPGTLPKTQRLSEALKSKGLAIPIEIDGGVTDQNAAALVKAGATVLVSGSHLYGSPDYAAAVKNLRLAAESAHAPGPAPMA
ncbi:MAG: ribulose-phosphate 3-epimerase [Deltaproteobacteria bacterium]|jgi:ribulose-phosphate 3-epimerase|nr:ribulose-phosphate 3-epimerase [Deltaproteobacteria bacterium]